MYKRAGIVAWSSARIILGRVGMGGVEGGGFGWKKDGWKNLGGDLWRRYGKGLGWRGGRPGGRGSMDGGRWRSEVFKSIS